MLQNKWVTAILIEKIFTCKVSETKTLRLDRKANPCSLKIHTKTSAFYGLICHVIYKKNLHLFFFYKEKTWKKVIWTQVFIHSIPANSSHLWDWCRHRGHSSINNCRTWIWWCSCATGTGCCRIPLCMRRDECGVQGWFDWELLWCKIKKWR